MPNVISKSMLEKYLAELEKDEVNIAEAAYAYESAKAQLDVGLHRYIALRQFVEEQLGKSPYADDVSWPPGPYADERGRFRFTGMQVGDAIVQVLEEAAERWPNEPALTLASIIEQLSEGGLGFPVLVQARSVNAALLKTGGVKRGRTTDNEPVYWVDTKPEEEEADEPPPF